MLPSFSQAQGTPRLHAQQQYWNAFSWLALRSGYPFSYISPNGTSACACCCAHAFSKHLNASVVFCSVPKPLLQNSPNLIRALRLLYSVAATEQQSSACLRDFFTPYPSSYITPSRQQAQCWVSSLASTSLQYRGRSLTSEVLMMSSTASQTWWILPQRSPFQADLRKSTLALEWSCATSCPCSQRRPRLYSDLTYQRAAALQKYSMHLWWFLYLALLKQKVARLFKARGKWCQAARVQYLRAVSQSCSKITLLLSSSYNPFSQRYPKSVSAQRCPLQHACFQRDRYSYGVPHNPFQFNNPNLYMAQVLFFPFAFWQYVMALAISLSIMVPSQ